MPQMKQGGIEVNKMVQDAIPPTHQAAGNRNASLDKAVQSGRMAREETHSSMQADMGHVTHNKGMKKANSVKEVFGKR